MADEERINISVWLRDRLTGPLSKVIKHLQDLNRVDAKMAAGARANTRVWQDRANKHIKAGKAASYAYSQEKRIFDQMARKKGLYQVGGKGAWFDKQTRATATQVKLAKVQLATEAKLAKFTTAERFAERMTRMTAAFTQTNKRAHRMADTTYHLAKSFGAGERASRQMHTSMMRSWRNLPNVVGASAARVGEHMSRIMTKQSEIQSGLKKGWAIGVGAPAALAGGYAVHQGFKRLNAFEGADVRLGIFDYNEKQRETIMHDVNEMLLGTFIPLDEGMTTATKLLSTGMDLDDFNSRAQAVFDVASAFAPNDLAGVSMVYGQIENKGWLTGEERAQLAERMIPITIALAEHLGTTEEEIYRMVENKEISSDLVWEVTEKMAPGAGKAMGDTFLGSFKLISAALGRMGYEFDRGFSEQLESLFDTLTETIDVMAPMFHDFGSNIGRGLEVVVKELPRMGAVIAPLEEPLKALFSTFGDIMPEIMEGITYFIGALALIAVPVIHFTTALLQMIEPFLPVIIPALLLFLHVVAGFTILVTLTNLIWGFGLATKNAFVVLGKLGGGVKKLFGILRNFKLGAILKTITSPFVKLFGFFAGAAAKLAPILAKVGLFAKDFWVKLTWGGGWIAQIGMRIANFFALIRAGGGIFPVVAGYAAAFWAKVGGFSGILAKVTAPFLWLWRTIGGGAGILKALGFAFRGLLMGLRAVPVVGWIITAVWLLVEAFQWAYRELEPFRKAVDWLVTNFQDLDVVLDEVSEKLREFLKENLPNLQKFADIMQVLTGGPKRWEMMAEHHNAQGEVTDQLNEQIFGTQEKERPATEREAHDAVAGQIRGWFSSSEAPSTARELEDRMRGVEAPDNTADLEDKLASGDTGPSDDTQVTDMAARWERVLGMGVPRGEIEHLMDNEDLVFGSPEMAQRLLDKGYQVPTEGFFSGGYTGDGPTSAVAGVVHGQEYVTNAWATRSVEASAPGALAYINATGKLPAGNPGPGMNYSPTVHLTVGSGTDPSEVAAVVRAELARQGREMRRAYMTPTLRGAR